MSQITINTLKIDDPIHFWFEAITSKDKQGDVIILSEDIDDGVWFTSNISQYISCNGKGEVSLIYGELVSDLASFIKQVNMSMPCGRKLPYNYHALWDVLLNFETEPENRYLIWSDTQHLFKLDPISYYSIFLMMQESAYLNRNGKATIKDNNEPYRVNQKNIFIFCGIRQEEIETMISEADKLAKNESKNAEIALTQLNIFRIK